MTTKKRLEREKIIKKVIILYEEDNNIGVVELSKRVKRSTGWVSGILKLYRELKKENKLPDYLK